MNTNGPIPKLAAAFVKAQKEMSNANKDSKNPFFKSKYADINSVREAVLPPLNNNGISIAQPMIMIEGKQFVRTTMIYENGEMFWSDTEIVVKANANAQEYGSAQTYARRYGLQALVCIGAEDVDAEDVVGRGKPAESKANSYSPKATTKASSSFRPASKTAAAMPAVEATEEGWQ